MSAARTFGSAASDPSEATEVPAPTLRDDAVQVSVVGNAAIDITFRVEHLPAAGETLLALPTRESGIDFGGKGANQALICARSGVKTSLFAALGTDAEGDRYLAHLSEQGVDVQFLHRCAAATDVSMITVDRNGENTIVTRSDAATGFRPELATVLKATSAGDWVALQGNLSESITADVLREAHLAGRHTFLNPGPVNFDCKPMLADVDVLVVNQVEAFLITAQSDPAAAAQALHKGGAKAVFVTLGARGVLYCGADGIFTEAAIAAEAIDTVGAGDAFCGVLLAGLAMQFSVRHALRWAQAAAAFTVARSGAQNAFPSVAMLSELRPLQSLHHSQSGSSLPSLT